METLTIHKKAELQTSQRDFFLKDVVTGLSSSPKSLPSKYFYDREGDRLFHHISQQPEYYLTCAEYEILQNQNIQIFSHINIQNGLRIIEPGAGDGIKTRLLISHLMENSIDIVYQPIDISPNVLDILCNSILQTYPQLCCEPMVGDYSKISGRIAGDNKPRLMLFLGSNIGNYNHDEAVNLLCGFASVLNSGDFFLLGADLVKDPRRILAAYNDGEGVTAQFNYNLLTRINRELGANFVVRNFGHYPVYNPGLQRAESYLISKVAQQVYIEAANQYFHFYEWEPVHTEISRKFTIPGVENLAREAGFSVIANYTGSGNDYCCSLWKVV
jgi:dimethylhistidine N-methyltransferase